MKTMARYPAIIGGERVMPGSTMESIDPSTGRPCGEVARCGAQEVSQAVQAARAAEIHWRRTLPADRARVLHAFASLIRLNLEELARIESIDTGKPLRQARVDAAAAARYFEFYAGTVESLYGETIPAVVDGFAYTVREPWGVTAHIVPWNYPLQISCRSVAPALATGNCCVLKPAEEASMSAVRLAELALEAGLPPGALNVVPGLGNEAGAALASHPNIDHLAFTGSPEVGSLVTKAAADNCVPVTLELGGKSPNIVFADANLKAAVPVIMSSILTNAGQTCSAGSRLLVQREIHAQLVEVLAEQFAKVTIGPGLDDPELGPIISERQRDRVASYVEKGKAEAHLVTGGRRPSNARLQGGFFFEPTLFDDAPPSATIARDEIFGPVLVASTFDGPEQALSLANGTDYGLVAAIWTSDVSKAHWLARELQVGQVYVNTYGAGPELPFGGVGRSGHGREKGYQALTAYTQTKSVVIKFQI